MGNRGPERGARATPSAWVWLEIYQAPASHLSVWWAWHHRPHLVKKRPLGELTFTERFWVCAVLCAVALLMPTTLCRRSNYFH